MSALVLSLIAATVQAAFTVVSAVMLARIYAQLAGRGETDSGLPISGKLRRAVHRQDSEQPRIGEPLDRTLQRDEPGPAICGKRRRVIQ